MGAEGHVDRALSLEMCLVWQTLPDGRGSERGLRLLNGLQNRDRKGAFFQLSRPGWFPSRGRNVRKGFRRLRSDRFLADPKAHRGIRRDREHNIRGIVSKGAAVPLGEAEHCRCADLVRKDVWTEPARDRLAIRARGFSGSSCGHAAAIAFVMFLHKLPSRRPGTRH